MSGKHRKSESRTKRIAVVGVATATATALTAGAAPPPPKPAPDPVVVNKNVQLAAAVNAWPSPDQIPDLTGGLGSAGYDLSQTVVELVVRAVVENLNFAALAQAAGVDPQSLLGGLLDDPNVLLSQVLGGVLGTVPIDLSPLLDDVFTQLVTNTILIPVLQTLGITDAQGVTSLLKLLNLVGLDLSDPLNLANLNVPGLNVITAGPVFTLMKLLGFDLGWVPGLPNAVAGEINRTPYLKVGVNGLLDTLLTDLTGQLGALNPLVLALKGVIDGLTSGLPDVIDLRVPVTVGIGMGAFAVATGYDKVLADLRNQPGGANYQGVDPILGSITLLPMLLAFNPARPNGGALARFYPLFGLLGINTVNPETQATSSCGGVLCVPILNTGLSLGGANLIPILIDVGVEYHPSSDLAAWPNPFSLANNLMAGVLPTYMLRGLTLDTVTDQVTTQLGDILGGVLEGDPLALNLYLTLPSATLPLLEPLYLLSDVTSLATFGVLNTNPFGMLANALAPALSALVNLGYTDVVRNPDGTYTRTLTEAGDPMPFFSFPSGINPLQVPVDVVNLLVKGFQKEFFSGNPTPGTPNAITALIKLLTGGLGPLSGLGDILGGLTSLVTEQISPLAANAIPSTDAKMVTLSADPEGDASTGKHAAAADAPVPDDTGATPKHAADETETATDETETATDEKTSATTDPDTSKDDEESAPTTSPKPSSTTPKPTSPSNPVGDAVGGATHAVADAVGGVAHDVATGVAGVLKNLPPKKTTTTTTTTTTTKTDTDKDSTADGAGGGSSTASKPAA